MEENEAKRQGKEERDPFFTSFCEHLYLVMQKDYLLPGLPATPTWFCLSHSEYIPSLANQIVMIYPLSSCPSCGPAWIEGAHLSSACDKSVIELVLSHPWRGISRKMGKTGRLMEAVSTL